MHSEYTRAEAKSWAREKFHGATDLIVASHLLDPAAAAGVGTVVADFNSIKPVG